MPKATHHLENLINAPTESKLRKILLMPLGLLSFFYAWAVAARLLLYRLGIFRTTSLPCKVVSVGNISLGGTGKTPFTCLLAEAIRAGGYRVAVLSRGYKGNFQTPFGLVSDGEQVLMNAAEAGDEPYLLGRTLAGVPVIVGRKRAGAGRFAVERFHPDVILLDDGFQHVALKRDLNLLLIDSTAQFGNRYLFPRGVLREPLPQLSRADAFILTKTGQSSSIKNLLVDLRKWGEGRPVFQVTYAPRELLAAGGQTRFPAAALAGKKILAFCGIARPDSFREMLADLKAQIAAMEIFPDHYAYGLRDRERLFLEARELRADALVTTEKDMARWEILGPGEAPAPVWALSIRHVFREEEERRLFETFLFSRLGLSR